MFARDDFTQDHSAVGPKIFTVGRNPRNDKVDGYREDVNSLYRFSYR